jgi:hypothetical protein
MLLAVSRIENTAQESSVVRRLVISTRKRSLGAHSHEIHEPAITRENDNTAACLEDSHEKHACSKTRSHFDGHLKDLNIKKRIISDDESGNWVDIPKKGLKSPCG